MVIRIYGFSAESTLCHPRNSDTVSQRDGLKWCFGHGQGERRPQDQVPRDIRTACVLRGLRYHLEQTPKVPGLVSADSHVAIHQS